MFITLPSYSGLDHPTHDLEDKADKTNSCSVCHGDPDCLILLHWVFVSMHKLLKPVLENLRFTVLGCEMSAIVR